MRFSTLIPSTLALCLALVIGTGQTYGETATSSTVLHTAIMIKTTKDIGEGKIQPGTPVNIALKVSNDCDEPSPAGEMFVRFAVEPSLGNHPHSLVFETEKVALPSLKAGEQREILFYKQHQLPCLIDFIRDDWLLHEYQAVFVSDNNEVVIAAMPLTVSAYYYPGISHHICPPTK